MKKGVDRDAEATLAMDDEVHLVLVVQWICWILNYNENSC